MKLMLCNFSTPHLIDVASKLKEQSYDIVYWIGHGGFFKEVAQDKNQFPTTYFHLGLDAINAEGAPGIDESKFLPVDKNLVEIISKYEAQILSMMDAVDYTNIQLNKKRDIYYKYLRYWHGILTSLQPDAILFHDIPHVPNVSVIYRLAKILNIKTIMFTGLITIPDRLLFFEDFENYKELVSAYQITQKKNYKFENLSVDLQEYFKKQTVQKIDKAPAPTSPSMIAKQLKRGEILPNLSTMTRHLRSRSFLKTAFYYVRQLFIMTSLPTLDRLQFRGLYFKLKEKEWKKIRTKFKKEYESLTSNPDYSKKFIYIALHAQPERSTSAEGDIFSDQLLMVRMLSRLLPEGWLLFVKEHPLQWLLGRAHLGRYVGYYKELSILENVRLIPTDVSTFDLIRESQAVATVTGSVAWEAVLRGKPALLFGFTWHQHCSGSFQISTISDCKKALEKIESGFLPDPKKIIQFLGALDSLSVRANDRHNFNKNANINDKENVDNITNGFLHFLKTDIDKREGQLFN